MAFQSGALTFDVVLAVDAVTGIAVQNTDALVLAAELVYLAVCLEQTGAEHTAEQGEQGEQEGGSGLHVGLCCSISTAGCQCFTSLPPEKWQCWERRVDCA